MTDDQMALVARALAHPARVRIVRLLAAQAECRGQEVFSELPLAQSTISEHLRVLKEAGLVQSHPVGTAMVYCLVASVLDEFNQAIGEIAAVVTECGPRQGACDE
ncbi:MAG: metalloregulator ArsR/SmtB family transcription factor [Coriobacteriia bacterium]|nr:metalloregulator ArsR/SmtB family transcription factor [Coriobacteriia bacterium]